MIRSYLGRAPRIDRTAFVHDSAEIIGAVEIGRNASIWPGAVLRADVDRIRIGERSNIQDLTVIHCREGQPAIVGRGVTVGHRAVVHGSRIGDYALIGMGAVVMEAAIGRESLIGAGALVLKGMKIPPRSLVVGSPAKVLRRLTAAEIRELKASADSYEDLARRHERSSKVVF